MSETSIRRNDDGGRYELSIDGEIAGYAEFRQSPGEIIVTHTQTLRDYKGQGVATRLTEWMLADARERGERVVPKCPFLVEYLETHHEFDDIIDRG
ncbi:GNAT family N-acetyltransferase [Leifsonia flava]|uniref:N-acetyltransferase n=1 Tax=Orlajensenia leifsoniae TaxID=2561933 RepID=A0A4Y9QT89_9MICO|nr:GNAT family N-acetyltransferase [Leifsonia flava]TFV95068.1 N-acetyltransferase [Leifsonia flava]